jgi:hypothetical protein
MAAFRAPSSKRGGGADGDAVVVVPALVVPCWSMQDGTWRAKIDTSRAKQAMFPAEAAMGVCGFLFSWIRADLSDGNERAREWNGRCLRASGPGLIYGASTEDWALEEEINWHGKSWEMAVLRWLDMLVTFKFHRSLKSTTLYV